jgi:hypothetical protein
MNRDVDQIIKEKLDGLEKEPPAYVWSAINDRMLEIRHRKRVLVFWQSVAAAALILVSIGITYLVTPNKEVYEQSASVIKPGPASTNIRKMLTQQDREAQKKEGLASNSIVQTSDKPSNTTKQKTSAQQTPDTKHVNTTAKSNNTDLAPAVVITTSKNITTGKEGRSSSAVNSKEPAIHELHSGRPAAILADNTEIKAPQIITPGNRKKRVIYPLYAANNTPAYKAKVRRHKFIITGSVSPTYNYRNVGDKQASVVTVSNNNSFDESGIVSAAGGLNIRMESKSRWSFETGILYSQVGQEVSQTNMYPSLAGISSLAAYSGERRLKNTAVNITNTTINSLGEIHFPEKTPMAVEKGLQKNGVYLVAPMESLDQQPTTSTLKQLLDYIEIPLVVRYALMDKKTLITLSGGLSTNFLIDNSAYLTENGKQVGAGSTDGLSPVTYSSSVGLGVELPIGKSFRFSLEPRFKYFLSPVNSNGYGSFHPYSFGVFGGISFLLNGH